MPGNEGFERSNEGDKESKNVADDEPCDAAHDGENERFKEELEENIAAACANGFSDADFVSAFRNGNEHDVHDADTSDDEGD